MNWLDEGALFSQIGTFLSEDLGRGDLTTQATVIRNTHAKGRFLAKESMIVAGLEAVEAGFFPPYSPPQHEGLGSYRGEGAAWKRNSPGRGLSAVLVCAAGARLGTRATSCLVRVPTP